MTIGRGAVTMGKAAWFGAEATVNGLPMLVRSRDPLQTHADPARPHLLVVSFSYAIRDHVQLPSEADYDRLSTLEYGIFDSSEAVAHLVFVETGGGMVRYYCYTSDVPLAVDVIADAFDPEDPLDFASAEDPQWNVYRQRALSLSRS